MTLPLFILRDDVSSRTELPCEAGQSITLPQAIVSHAIKAMRLTNGDQLQLSDGRGTRVCASVIDSSEGIVHVEDVTKEPEPDVRLGLIQALAKGGRDEQAIEMATEIGVDCVMPWQSQRSIVQWKGNKTAKALGKWKDVLVGAAEQSRRARIPELFEMKTTKQLIPWMSETVEQGDVVVVLHQDATDTWDQFEHIAQTVAQHRTIWVAVGPEGGISDDEIDQFKSLGAHTLVIGSNILRASSAGSVALTLLSRVLRRYA